MAYRLEENPDSFNDEEVRRQAENNSHIRGLKRRHANNATLIALWGEYGRIARALRREYRGRDEEQEAGMLANWITASSLAQAALDTLLDEQVSIDRETAALSGQLGLEAADE